MYRTNKQLGITVVEVMVGLGILAVVVVAIGFSFQSYLDTRSQLLTSTKATYLAEEGYEIIRAIRDEDWSVVAAEAVDTTLYLDVTPTTLGITGTAEIIDTDYTRSFVLREVHRDADDDIVPSTDPSAALDSNSYTVEVSVVGPTGTVTMTSLISNVHDL